MYFEVYKKSRPFKRNQWYWRLRANNHEVIAHGEGYYNREDCLGAISLVRGTSFRTPIL